MDFLDLPDLGEPRETYKVYHIPGLPSNFITPVVAHDVPPDHRYYKHRLLPPSSKHHLSTTSRFNIGPQATAFPLLPLLPAEIRLKIWQLALPGPRVVRVYAYDEAHYLSLFRSPTPPPQILFVCRESREQALLSYELCFGIEHINAPSTIYFNHELDTLYLKHEVRNGHGCEIVDFGVELNCLPSVTRKGLSNVERVAISHRVGQDPILYWFEHLETFEGLEEFIIVAERGNPPAPDDAQLVDADGGDEDLKGWRDWSESWAKIGSFWWGSGSVRLEKNTFPISSSWKLYHDAEVYEIIVSGSYLGEVDMRGCENSTRFFISYFLGGVFFRYPTPRSPV